MWVVKLGGSLYDSPELAHWLNQLARSPRPVVVVPGGGPFADQVRSAQAHWEFDDAAAHRMALLAMEQMAHMLCALHPRFMAFNDIGALNRVLDQGRVGVWLPSRMVLADPAVETGWTVTSDSLAVWLADRLGANGVLLVKSSRMLHGTASVVDLQRIGLLDGAFRRYAERCQCPLWVAHRADSDAFSALLDGDTALALSLAC